MPVHPLQCELDRFAFVCVCACLCVCPCARELGGIEEVDALGGLPRHLDPQLMHVGQELIVQASYSEPSNITP